MVGLDLAGLITVAWGVVLWRDESYVPRGRQVVKKLVVSERLRNALLGSRSPVSRASPSRNDIPIRLSCFPHFLFSSCSYLGLLLTMACTHLLLPFFSIHLEKPLFGGGNRRLPKTYCPKSHALLSDEEESMKPSRKDYL